MKVVSLKSTLSTFWVVLVVLGGLDDSTGLVCLIYVRPIPVVVWFGYIYVRPFARFLRALKLF